MAVKLGGGRSSESGKGYQIWNEGYLRYLISRRVKSKALLTTIMQQSRDWTP